MQLLTYSSQNRMQGTSFCVHFPDKEILGKQACGSPEFEL